MFRKLGDFVQRAVALTGFVATTAGTVWLAYGGYKMVKRRRARDQALSLDLELDDGHRTETGKI
jgi:hypothetical protein